MSGRSLSMDSNFPAISSNTWMSLTGLLHAALIEEQAGIFPFLDLPAELRNMIYRAAMSGVYKSIDKTISSHVQDILVDGHNLRLPYHPPRVIKSTPGLLLVCRQVHDEAMPFLKRESLVLNNGLMDFRLSNLINVLTIRNLTSIVLTHSGHNVLDGRLRLSFLGHQRLVFGLVRALKDYGHSLQYLELQFCSPQLKWHVENCWSNRSTCDMKRWLMDIVNHWCQVRGIRKVEICGWLPYDLKDKMLSFMQSDYNPFAKLPMNVINRIAAYTADFSGISKALNKANSPGTRKPTVFTDPVASNRWVSGLDLPVLSTPGILLADRSLNKLFTPPIGHQPLVLDIHGQPRKRMLFTEFLAHGTAMAISSLEIRIRHRAWFYHIKHFLRHYMTGSKLESFHLHFDDNQRPRPSRQAVRDYPDPQLVADLDGLRYLGSVGKVTFGGDLARPDGKGKKYLQNLTRVMMGPVNVSAVDQLFHKVNTGTTVTERFHNGTLVKTTRTVHYRYQ